MRKGCKQFRNGVQPIATKEDAIRLKVELNASSSPGVGSRSSFRRIRCRSGIASPGPGSHRLLTEVTILLAQLVHVLPGGPVVFGEVPQGLGVALERAT